MRNLGFLAVIFSILLSSYAFAPQKDGDGIQFQDIAFNDALELAKKENKLIFMDAYAVWCGPCKMLDRNTFSDPKVAEVFNKTFINLKKDMEKGEGVELARRFQVTAYPTLFVINAKGEVVKRILGYRGPDQLLNEVKEFTK